MSRFKAFRQEFVLFSDSAVVFAVRLLAAVTVYVTQILLARLMGRTELGIFVYTLSWLWILGLIATLGLAGAASRFIPQCEAAGERGHISGYLHVGRRITLSFGALLTLAGLVLVFVVDAGGTSNSVAPFVPALLAIPFLAVTSFHTGIARAFLWFLLASLTGMLIRPALLLLAVVAVWLAGIPLSATLVMSMVFVIIVAIAMGQYAMVEKRTRAHLSGVVPDYHTRRWLRIAIPILVAEMFVSYFIDLNIIVSGVVLSPQDIAVYNAALRTVAVIIFGLSAVGVAAAPRISRLYASGDKEGLQRLVAQATQLMFWPSLAAVLLLVQFGKQVLGLFGPDFVQGYHAMLIAGAAQVMVAAGGPLLPLLNVTGHQDRCLVVFLTVFLVTPVLYLVLVPAWGLVGGAVAILLVSVLWTVWLYALVVQHLDIRPTVLSFRGAS